MERRFLKSQEENEFAEGGNGNPPSNPPTDPNSEDLNSGTETGFDLPELKGKTPAEIQEAFKVYKAAVVEQGKRLNDLENRPPVQVAQPSKEDDEEITPDKFWENPAKHTADIVNKTVQRQLKEIVAPLEQDFAAQRVRRVWDELEELHPNYKSYKSLMDEILKRNGITAPNLPTLVSIFEMAVGKAALSGNIPAANGNDNGEPVNNNPPRRAAPPQHPPSSQPLPNAAPKKPKRRQLTESERKVAQMQGLTPDEYLDELEKAAGDLEPTAKS